MSMWLMGIGDSAPVGQWCMHCKPSQTTQGISSGEMKGAPWPRRPVGSIWMHCAGQTSMHLRQREQVSRKLLSGCMAPGGRIHADGSDGSPEPRSNAPAVEFL